MAAPALRGNCRGINIFSSVAFRIGLLRIAATAPAALRRRCPSWVNRVDLAVGRLLPVYPDEQTLVVSRCMSHTGPGKAHPTFRSSSRISFSPRFELLSFHTA